MASSAAEPSAAGYLASRVRRGLVRTRTEGICALAEAKQLNVVERARVAYAKRRWRHRHGVGP